MKKEDYRRPINLNNWVFWLFEGIGFTAVFVGNVDIENNMFLFGLIVIIFGLLVYEKKEEI